MSCGYASIWRDRSGSLALSGLLQDMIEKETEGTTHKGGGPTEEGME
ncbi:MAG: hypothetical protein NTX84_03470 [Nitrospirae bacterium]|nr:hypothetical protein [Nitrospirota bacterium]